MHAVSCDEREVDDRRWQMRHGGRQKEISYIKKKTSGQEGLANAAKASMDHLRYESMCGRVKSRTS